MKECQHMITPAMNMGIPQYHAEGRKAKSQVKMVILNSQVYPNTTLGTSPKQWWNQRNSEGALSYIM